MQEDDRRFSWHPAHAGKSLAEVRRELERDLEHDQRAYALAMSAPDEQEAAILTRVVELERRWGIYHMDWATAVPGPLAERIAEFEWLREERREMLPFHAPPAPSHRTNQPGDDGHERPWWAFWRR